MSKVVPCPFPSCFKGASEYSPGDLPRCWPRCLHVPDAFSFLQIILWSRKIQAGIGWRKKETSLRRRWPPQLLGWSSFTLHFWLRAPTAWMQYLVWLELSLLDKSPRQPGLWRNLPTLCLLKRAWLGGMTLESRIKPGDPRGAAPKSTAHWTPNLLPKSSLCTVVRDETFKEELGEVETN